MPLVINLAEWQISAHLGFQSLVEAERTFPSRSGRLRCAEAEGGQDDEERCWGDPAGHARINPEKLGSLRNGRRAGVWRALSVLSAMSMPIITTTPCPPGCMWSANIC